MPFRGREMAHVEQGYQMMEEIVQALQEVAKIERPAQMLGKRITMVLGPAKGS